MQQKIPANNNFFDFVRPDCPEEVCELLLSEKQLRIERIVTPPGVSLPSKWYDQDENEWVMLLAGEASLYFEQQKKRLHLHKGDYLLIPAHTRHRLERCSAEQNCLWLAIFFPA